MTENILKSLAIYQTESGEIRLKEDLENETIWADLNQVSELFGRDKSVISRHIKNIFKEEELDIKSTVAFFATVQKEGNREVNRNIECFNLDVILSVGYRVNSKIATQFRKWATQTLKQHITKGFTINSFQIEKNYQKFLSAVDDIKTLAKGNTSISSDNILDLVKTFSATWFSLESYDKQKFPEKNNLHTSEIPELEILAKNLYRDIQILKAELLSKKEATELFAQEKNTGNLEGILGNILQSVFGEDAYPSTEEKAAHLMYFIIKNHPFNDGNKRTGAFSFIWFLHISDYDFTPEISPETLTALALLVAESKPNEKDKMIGLILLLMKKE